MFPYALGANQLGTLIDGLVLSHSASSPKDWGNESGKPHFRWLASLEAAPRAYHLSIAKYKEITASHIHNIK